MLYSVPIDHMRYYKDVPWNSRLNKFVPNVRKVVRWNCEQPTKNFLDKFCLSARHVRTHTEDFSLPISRNTVAGGRLKLGDTCQQTLQSMNDLTDLYEAWNKPGNAKEWRAKVPQTEAVEE